jgi:hypothetical protein
MDLDVAATAPAPPAAGAGDGGGSVGGSSHTGGNNNAPVFREALTWQAYGRTPVLSMVVTSYGEHAIFDLHCNDNALLLSQTHYCHHCMSTTNSRVLYASFEIIR